VKCYIDNGFCESIYDFGHPVKMAGFIQDLLGTFNLVDFLEYIAIKQVFDVMTQCPGKMIEDLLMVNAVSTCPDPEAVWSTDAAVLATYRNEPVTGADGKITYLGFKNEYEEACGSCGVSTSDDGTTLYGYNFAWNTEVGTRDFWEDESKGYLQRPSWWKNCPSPYKRRDFWGRWSNQPCELEPHVRFINEECTKSSQCSNGVTGGYVDVACDKVRKVCVFDEDRSDVASSSGEVAAFRFNENECSNCRNSPDACKAFDGADVFTVDTSKAAIGGGMLSLGAVGMIGGALLMKKRGGKRAKGEAGVEMEKTRAVMV